MQRIVYGVFHDGSLTAESLKQATKFLKIALFQEVTVLNNKSFQ